MRVGGYHRSNVVLFTLVLLLVKEVCKVQGCRVGSVSECEKAPFVPGHNLAGEGFDVVRMRRTGAYVINVKAHLADNHTCTLCPNRFQGGQVTTQHSLLTHFLGVFNLSKPLSLNSSKTTFALLPSVFSALYIPRFLFSSSTCIPLNIWS